MSADLDPATVTGTSSAATEKATGKPWAEWVTLLDEAGGREMNHKQIVNHLVVHHRVPEWWRQQIAVGYEKSRRLRAHHEMVDGYQISRSRTLAAAAKRVYDAWLDPQTRAGWLPEVDLAVRKATPPKSIRLNWSDGSRLEVRLTAKGADRTAVTVQQDKIADAATAEEMKAYWVAALDRLQQLLEG